MATLACRPVRESASLPLAVLYGPTMAARERPKSALSSFTVIGGVVP